MVIFHSYVSLPEGTFLVIFHIELFLDQEGNCFCAMAIDPGNPPLSSKSFGGHSHSWTIEILIIWLILPYITHILPYSFSLRKKSQISPLNK